jgi:cytidylate kinase
MALSNINIKFKPSKESGKSETYLNGNIVEKEIRELKVSSKVSEVSALGLVRDFLVAQQRQMGFNIDMVMDGRDIGTVVFPEARVKFFIFADLEIRAQRRYNELNKKGSLATYDDVLSNLEHRDLIDTTRNIAPLKKAEDAFQIDNSKIGVSEQLKLALDYINDILKT